MLLAEQASLCSAIICAGDYTCKNVCYSRSDSNTIQIHTQHAYLSWGPHLSTNMGGNITASSPS